jgi:two-component system NtrC family sensor kinase
MCQQEFATGAAGRSRRKRLADARRADVALQWRIRHKLMLGLTLVVGIMALLLGGTLRGLWSYWQTMNTIRSLVYEQRAAEDVKASFEAVKGIIQDAQSEQGQGAGREEALHLAVQDFARKLDDYDQRNLETHNHGYNPVYRDHILGITGPLQGEIGALEKAVHEWDQKQEFNANGAGEEQRAKWQAVCLQLNNLDRDTGHLLNSIFDELRTNIDNSRNHYQIALWMILPASVIGFLLICGLMGSFYAWVFNPIRDLEAGVKRVAAGDLDHRIELHSGDEMEELGIAFNDMMRKLQDLYSDLARQVNERSRQLVRSERLASVGFLAAGVAHEINNPLASIAFCSEALEARLQSLTRLLKSAVKPEEIDVYTKYLKMIQEEAFRCKNITERLLAFSRTGEMKREPADLGQLIQSVIDIAQHLPNNKGKEITFLTNAERVPGGRITAPVNAEEIKSVVLNLVVNALDSMDDGGKLEIRLGQRDGMAEMQFIDTGCGMTQDVLENIFEPFFTRSRTGKGTGLGLTISHRIINHHGGELDASSRGPSTGSTFTVRLPVQIKEPEPAAEAARPATRKAPEPRKTDRHRAA